MLDPSSQLQRQLQGSIDGALTPRRPILCHLNADTTWLLSLPYPDDSLCPHQRCRFNVLIDPWLRGPQSDVADWFSTQWHKIQSSVQTIQELNDFLHNREELELRAMHRSYLGVPNSRATPAHRSSNYIDAVVCSHEFTDHCHRKTLEEIDSSVPCLATTKAANIIRSWDHFEQVSDVPSFSKNADWRQTSIPSLPRWIAVARLVRDSDALSFHSAIAIFCKDARSTHPDGAEVVIYTPHGIQAEGLHSVTSADPPVRTLAFMHGLHDVSIPFTKQLNLGARNAVKCQTVLKSKYWVGTHDEVKVASGILAPFLRRNAYTLQEAIKAQEEDDSAAHLLGDEAHYVELDSGQTLLLN